MSKRALCATSTASPANARKRRTAAATGGARRSSSSRRPVSAAIAGCSRAPGLQSVWKRSASSRPLDAGRADLARPRAARPQAGRLEVEDDEGRRLEQLRLAVRLAQRDEVARPAQPRVAADGLVEERPREPDRHGRARA